MARNRKSQSVAIRFGPALKAFLLCLLIGGSGVGYVWQKEQINNLNQQITRRVQRLDWLKQQNESLRKQLATLRSPTFLETQIGRLGLKRPDPGQIVRLPEPTPEPARFERQTQFAARDNGTAVEH